MSFHVIFRQGDDVMLEEIRRFVSFYQLRQAHVAQMTHISQPYVSKFLRGEGRDISQRVKTAMYTWYLACRKNPARMGRICMMLGVCLMEGVWG